MTLMYHIQSKLQFFPQKYISPSRSAVEGADLLVGTSSLAARVHIFVGGAFLLRVHFSFRKHKAFHT